MDQTKEIDIDLKKIFLMMRKKVVYILLFTLLGGIVAGCFTEFFIDQKYTAKISLYVYSDMNQLSTQSSISYNDYTASTALVKSYLAVLESDAVLDKVAEKVPLPRTRTPMCFMCPSPQPIPKPVNPLPTP